MSDLLDVVLNGATAATYDEREALDVSRAVCAELARGADIEAACAAAIVAPDVFLGWTVDREDIASMYARALKVRARLLRDAPLRLARTLADRREGRIASPASLSEWAKAVQTEHQLVAALADRGEPPEATTARSETVVRVQFEPLPTWQPEPLSLGTVAAALVTPPTDNETDASDALSD